MVDRETLVTAAYAAVVEALATVVHERPMRGLHIGKVGDWTITLNASRDPVMHDGEEVSPWSAKVASDRYFVVAILNPISGMVGGMPEHEFVAEMEAFAQPSRTNAL